MFPWWLLLLTVGATYRLTRLVTRDQLPLVAGLRERLLLFWYPEFAEEKSRQRYEARRGRTPKPHWGGLGWSLAYLVTCDWCVSVWVGAGVVLAEWFWTSRLRPLGWVVAALLVGLSSAVTGLVAQREPD